MNNTPAATIAGISVVQQRLFWYQPLYLRLNAAGDLGVVLCMLPHILFLARCIEHAALLARRAVEVYLQGQQSYY